MLIALKGMRDELQKKLGIQTLIYLDFVSCCRHKATRTNDQAERENQPATCLHGTMVRKVHLNRGR